MPDLTITLSTDEHEQLVAYAKAFRHTPQQQVEVFVLNGLKIEMKPPAKATKPATVEKDAKATKLAPASDQPHVA